METNFNLDAIDFNLNKTQNLEAILIAPSGAGKSTTIGTYTGTVLYIHDVTEKHGPVAAAEKGRATILPLNLSFHPVTNEPLTADESYDLLIQALNVDFLKSRGVTAVAVDSATAVERIIRNTSRWSAACLSSKGTHNNFAEGAATIKMFDEIFSAFSRVQQHIPLDFFMTLIADVKEKAANGAYTEVRPRLSTYGIAENVLQQFDVLLVGEVTKTVNGETSSAHCFQFGPTIGRESKDEYGVTKKMFNFTPRVTGAGDKLKPYMLADLDAIKALKSRD